ncbi:lipase family protein [Reyranella sp.]|uniref:lipase family protein n=1 Tax=Reyranella sp. TaxID=1929291 RepID=UPI003BAABA2D
MPNNRPFNEIRANLNIADWTKPDFDLRKAYVCALFSELTYQRIADFELTGADRVNVIPCFAYQSAVTTGHITDFDTLMRSLELGEHFVVIRRYAIVVGIRTPNVIVIAIRGTKYLYDWLVNLRASRVRLGDGTPHFHKGFIRAIWPCFEPVGIHMRKFLQETEDSIPVVVTGHSLGGALAGIMHALWRIPTIGEFTQGRRVMMNYQSTSDSYTFGMPRYCDFDAMVTFKHPHHLYNDRDIVPSVPPTWLGFENCFDEYRLDGFSIEKMRNRETINFGSWLWRLGNGSGIADHAIEVYRERIGQNI